MSTNYYWTPKQHKCPTCDRPFDNSLHIGKSSAGWCFSLRVYPDKGVHNLGDWLKFLHKGTITDEYDRVISSEDMIKRIVDRPIESERHPIDGHCIGHGPGPYDYIEGNFC